MGDIILALIMFVLSCVVSYKVGYFNGVKSTLFFKQVTHTPVSDAVYLNKISSEYLAAMGAADFPDNGVALEGDQTAEDYLKTRGLS